MGWVIFGITSLVALVAIIVGAICLLASVETD